MLDQAASRNFAGDMPTHMGEVYVQLLACHSREFAQVFRIFAAHRDVTVLFNCAAGKDRTGVTAMLLLLLAGVPEETVVADYVPSENNMKELFALQRQQLSQAGQPVPPMSVFSSAPEEIRMALDYLQQHYAGAEDYLLQAGVSPAEIAAVRGCCWDAANKNFPASGAEQLCPGFLRQNKKFGFVAVRVHPCKPGQKIQKSFTDSSLGYGILIAEQAGGRLAFAGRILLWIRLFPL